MALGANGKFRVAATVSDKRGRILSSAVNSYIKTHPKQALYARRVRAEKESNYLHAEVYALIKCRNPKQAYKITVVRVNARGEMALAKPCPICQLAIKEYGIKVVEYSI